MNDIEGEISDLLKRYKLSEILDTLAFYCIPYLKEDE